MAAPAGIMIKYLRCAFRLAGFVAVTVFLPLDWLVGQLSASRAKRRQAAATLLHRWARFTVRLLGCRVTVRGRPPGRGLCVSNHLSYLDIAVFGSTTPLVFVSKHDVVRWPVFGQWAAMCGTLFIKREQKGHVADVGEQMAEVLRSNVPLVLFPEGTSSSGEAVLPFKSSLFEPAVEHGWPVTPMRIAYELPGGSVATEVAYWGEMTLLPHLLKLLTKRSIHAFVEFGEALEPGADRKELCRRARAAVTAMSPISSPAPERA